MGITVGTPWLYITLFQISARPLVKLEKTTACATVDNNFIIKLVEGYIFVYIWPSINQSINQGTIDSESGKNLSRRNTNKRAGSTSTRWPESRQWELCLNNRNRSTPVAYICHDNFSYWFTHKLEFHSHWLQFSSTYLLKWIPLNILKICALSVESCILA